MIINIIIYDKQVLINMLDYSILLFPISSTAKITVFISSMLPSYNYKKLQLHLEIIAYR